MVTLNDVAKAVGVSQITVSRALRDPEKVSEDLCKTILRVVDEMGYVPDYAARQLASRSSDVIGLVLPTRANFALMAVMQGIEDRIAPTGFRVQYGNTRFDRAEEANQIKMFAAQVPAGIIVTGLAPTAITSALLKQAACPVVEIVDISETGAGLTIGIDTREAARVATRHMLDKGYRRFALLGGADSRGWLHRQGYRSVMEEAGLYDPALVMTDCGLTNVELGCRLLRRLMDLVPNADGAFCHNDDIALGVLFECQRLGIKIPDAFGICGFNDLDYAEVSEPSLTSVNVPRYDLGVRAADMMLRAIDNPGERAGVVDVGFRLMERQSTRRAP